MNFEEKIPLFFRDKVRKKIGKRTDTRHPTNMIFNGEVLACQYFG